jgi:hypothetical protein
VVHVCAEDAPVDVQLIQHDPAETPQEGLPLGVMREDAHVQHVRVRDQRRGRIGADFASPRRGRVAVVDLEPRRRQRAEAPGQRAESGKLVPGQRLGRVEEQRLAPRILEKRLEHRRREQQRLARRRRGDEQNVRPAAGVIETPRLMAEQPLDPVRAERVVERGRQRALRRVEDGRRRRELPVVDDHRAQRRVFEQVAGERAHREAKLWHKSGTGREAVST